MSEKQFSLKNIDQLERQTQEVSNQLGTSITQPSTSDDVFSLSSAELKDRFPARYGIYLDSLRNRKTTSSLPEEERQKAIKKIAILNNLDNYISDHYSNPAETTLREKQLSVFEDLRDFLEEGGTEGYFKLPTGFGKTVLFTEFIEATKAKTMVVVPTRILLDQTEEKFAQFASDVELGKIYAYEKQYGKQVTITTYDSVRLGIKNGTINPKDYDLLILDEAHKALSQERVSNVQKFTNAIKIGLTATPFYSNEKNLQNLLNTEIHTITIKESVEEGLLSPFSVYLAETEVDLSTVSVTSTGEYDERQLETAINIAGRNEGAVNLYKDLFDGKQALAYCVSIKHAQEVALKFRENGITAEVISGNLPRVEQDRIRNEYRKGKIKILCNANILIEGFDEPQTEICLNLRPTLSRVTAEQRAGRVLRLDPNNPKKHAYIVDFLDKNYGIKNIPVTFAEIVEEADVKPEGKKSLDKLRDVSEEHLIQKHLDSTIKIGSLSVVTNADEVMRIVSNLISKKYQPAPEGWMIITDLAHLVGRDQKMVRNKLVEYLEIHPDWAANYISKNHRLSMHYSPELVDLLNEQLPRRKAPEGWETIYQLSQKTAADYATIVRLAKHYIDEDTKLHGFYTNKGGYNAEYYSPELIKLINTRINNFPVAPEGWETPGSTSLINRLGKLRYAIVQMADKYREEHPDWFGQFNRKGKMGEFYSPELISQLELSFSAESVPRGWENALSLVKIVERKTFLIRKVAELFREEHPEWFKKYKGRGGRLGEFYSPELVEEISNYLKSHSGRYIFR